MRINALGNTATDFASDDYIAIDGITNASRKMAKATLLEKTAENSLEANKATIFDESVYSVDIYPMATIGYYIVSNQGVGQTINYTPASNASFAFVVYSCKKGQSFHIVGRGGTTPRLWCFVDASDKIVSVAEEGAAAYTPGIEVTAPSDGKLIVNTNKTLGTGDPTPSVFVRLKTTDEINHVKDKTFIYENVFVVDDTNKNKYINTSGNVGTTINYTPTTGANYAFCVFECKRLDTFKIKGIGANAPRLWCFVDSSDKIVCNSASGVNTGVGDIEVTAPVDGKLIVNVLYNNPYYVKKEIAVGGKVTEIETDVSKNKTDIAALNGQAFMWKDVFQPNAQQRYYIPTNLNIGDTVSLVPVSIPNYSFLVLDCSAGDVFKVRGVGGSSPRLWCFVDSSDKVLSVAASSATTGADYITLVAEQNGKLIVNTLTAPASGNEPNVLVLQTCQEAKKELADEVGYFVKSEFLVDYTPYEEVNDVLADVSTSSEQVIFDIYDAMDALVAANPSMITKYDAATLTDLTYPRYANGISSGDPDYLETPAYKVYAYKISSHTDRGNQFALPKKKLLLVSGVHGPEHRACINTLAFINHLVNNPSDDIFGLLSRVEFWFVPCVNGYGIIHATRTNANGVDINRSFGTKYWQVDGNPGDGTYSGATPDTEFETLLIEGMYNYVKPDFFVDHHCTPTPGATQFYTESPSYNVLLRSMKAVTEISRFDIKNFQTDFGTKFQLFVGTNPLQVPNGLQKQAGMGDVWFYEHGVEAATIEMFGYINYENGGQVDPTGHRGTNYWKVMEYILRNQLCNYLQIVL